MRAFFYFWPVPLVILALLDFFYGFNLEFLRSDSMRILAQVSFFNQTHVLISFLLFHVIPSFKEWTHDFKIDAQTYKQKWIVNGLLFFIFTQLCLQPVFKAQHWNLTIFYLVINLAGAQHILFQSFGFSMILSKMNERFLSEPLDLKKLKFSETLERAGVHLLFASTFFIFIFQLWSQSSLYNSAVTFHFSMVALAIAGLGFSVWVLPKAMRLKKMLFMIRYLIIPFWPFTFTAVLAGWLFHGVEYVIFSDVVLKGSEASKNPRFKKMLFLFLAIQILFTIPLVMMSLKMNRFILPNGPLFIVVKGIVHTFILMHFYFDRFAYRKIYNPDGFKEAIVGTFGNYLK